MTLLFSMMGLINGVLWTLLFLVTLVLIAVILLQEGKGGGLAEAFGGAGAETFGVKAHGINRFTAIVGGVFVVLCILLVKFRSGPDQTPLVDAPMPSPQVPGFPDGFRLPPDEAPAPADPNGNGTAPAGDPPPPPAPPAGDGK